MIEGAKHDVSLADTVDQQSGIGERLTVHIRLYTLMRQDAPAIHIHLIPNRHIVAQHAHILQPCPSPDRAIPPNNRALDPRMILNCAPPEQDRPLYPHAIADDDVGPNGDVRADAAVLADFGRGVDENVAAVDVVFGGLGELLAMLLGEGGEVEAGAREEVFGLADVHPEALEVEGVELAVFADGGEGFLLDGCGAELDAGEHGGVEDVDARVDAVADELDGFLDKAIDAGGVVGFVDHDTVFGGLFDFGDDDSAFFAVGLVKSGEFVERIVTDDVGVEDEEGGGVFAEGFFGEFEGAGGA